MCIFFTSELCTFFYLSTLACTFTSQQTQAHNFYQIMSTYINRCHMHALVHAHTCSRTHNTPTHPHMHSRTHPHTMLLFSFCHWGFHPMLITILYTGPLSTLAHPQQTPDTKVGGSLSTTLSGQLAIQYTCRKSFKFHSDLYMLVTHTHTHTHTHCSSRCA